jgi:hypothetical protein
MVSMIPGQTQREARTATKSHLAEIVAALEAYKARNGYYPCVASRSELPKTANYGRQVLANCVTDTSTPAGTERIDAGGGNYVRVGVVPVRDLLLSDRYMADEYGNRYSYALMEKATSAATFGSAAGKLTILDAAGGTVTSEGGYSVISHGKDGKGAYRDLSGGLKVACGASANLDVENCDGDATFRAASYSENPTETMYFDDFLHYATKQALGTCFRIDGEGASSHLVSPVSYTTVFDGYSGASPAMRVYTVGDINGDGFGDVIATSAKNPAGHFAGYVYVVFGGPSGISNPLPVTALNGTNGFRLEARNLNLANGYPWYNGMQVHSADLNDDGFDDIIIREPKYYASGMTPRLYTDAYVVFGKASGWAATSLITDYADGTQGFKMTLEHGSNTPGSEHFLGAIAAGDVNGDGYKDLYIGALNEWRETGQYNSVFVVFGMNSGWPATIALHDLDGTDGFEIIGPTVNDNGFGERGMASGDINGDGYEDVIISKSYYQSTYSGPLGGPGGVYVVFGKANPWAASLDAATLDGDDGFRLDGRFIGGSYWDMAGATIDSADMNHDGYDDLIVGVPWGESVHVWPKGVEVHVIYGKASGWAASAAVNSFADGANGYVIYSDINNALSGYAQIGNLNNDDYPDLLITAPYNSAWGGTDNDAHVVFGKQTWPAATALSSLMDGTQGFSLQHSASTQGIFGHNIVDITGDGYGEILIGDALADSYRGYAYGVYGKPGSWNASYTLDTLCAP